MTLTALHEPYPTPTPRRKAQRQTLSEFQAQPEAHRPLWQRLLKEGGHIVVFPRTVEEDAQKLLDRGQRWPPKHLIKMIGRPSQCHANAAELYEANGGRLQLVTGYGLCRGGDGLLRWYQHSWLWHVAQGRVVETTLPRLAYWGFLLDESEAEMFCFENW